MNPAQRIGLLLGPVAALLVGLLIPTQIGEVALSTSGRLTAAVATLMAVWWLSEALPLSATALLPLALFPVLGITDMGGAAAPYANPVIFLFMGGFILGLGMERWGLHKRLALHIVAAVGSSPTRLVGGFMLATALLSMWISNTAAAVILLPVGISVVAMLREQATDAPESALRNFGLCLMLGIAWGASIGGVGTLIGSPPNLVMASYAQSQLDCDIGMLEWMRFGLPLVAIFLPLTWLYLTHLAFPIRLRHFSGGRALMRSELDRLGRVQPGEKVVAVVFGLTALAWVFRPFLADLFHAPGLSDAGIAMLAALLLFLVPVPGQRGARAMDWDTAVKLPWGILLLFGGGLSLAAAISGTGVDRYIAAVFTGLEGSSMLIVLLLLTALVIFLTELTSNTAIANTFVPIMAAVGIGLGLPVMPLLVAVAVAASFAFMLPVATPPNAVVFSSGMVRIGQMARAGLALNIVAIGVVAVAGWLAGPTLCG